MANKQKCFACNRTLGKHPHIVAVLGDDQIVFVGSECYKHIKNAGKEGYQPPLGGPKLTSLEFGNQEFIAEAKRQRWI